MCIVIGQGCHAGRQIQYLMLLNPFSLMFKIDLGKTKRVTSIATQGKLNMFENAWVTNYKIEYSYDGVNFYYAWPGPSQVRVIVRVRRGMGVVWCVGDDDDDDGCGAVTGAAAAVLVL